MATTLSNPQEIEKQKLYLHRELGLGISFRLTLPLKNSILLSSILTRLLDINNVPGEDTWVLGFGLGGICLHGFQDL